MLIRQREANKIVKRCVCSACWGELVGVFLTNQPHQDDPENYVSDVYCKTCKGEYFISKSWVEHKKQEAIVEYMSARNALKNAVPWMIGPSMGEAEIIRLLGF